MGNFATEENPIEDELNVKAKAGIYDNIKRLSSGDGSWRFENGALIITDETGVDRVLIGYGKDLF